MMIIFEQKTEKDKQCLDKLLNKDSRATLMTETIIRLLSHHFVLFTGIIICILGHTPGACNRFLGARPGSAPPPNSGQELIHNNPEDHLKPQREPST